MPDTVQMSFRAWLLAVFVLLIPHPTLVCLLSGAGFSFCELEGGSLFHWGLEVVSLLILRSRCNSLRSQATLVCSGLPGHFTLYGRPLKLLFVAASAMKSSVERISWRAEKYVSLPRT